MANAQGFQIYSDFQDDVNWIRKKFQEESVSYPPPIEQLAKHYLFKRLPILLNKSSPKYHYWRFKDPRLEKPSPYAPFWFAHAFGLKDKEVVRKLVLGYVYVTLSVSVRDDLLDGKVASKHAHVCLANLYLDKYFETFKFLFPPQEKFWYIFADSLNEWNRYESWSYLFRPQGSGFNPFSDGFLLDASRYLVAITMPVLAAIAFLTNNESQIPQIMRFARDYCMGFRILDDIRDWRKDLNVPNFNHSSVLYYVCGKLGKDFRGKMLEADVTSVLLDNDVIAKVYDAALKCLNIARDDSLIFSSPYITQFIDEHISLYTEERDAHIKLNSAFYERLRNVLSKAQ